MPSTEHEEVFKVWASDNMVYGPIPLVTLLQWVAEARVLPDTWVHCQVDNAWQPAGRIEALRSGFAAGQETASPADSSGAHHAAAPEELRQFAMFSGLSNSQLEQFLRFGELVPALPGELIIKKGDPGDAIFFVLLGEVRVRLLVGLEDKTLAHIPAGEFFGEMAMFNQAPRSADVVAETEARLLRLSSQAFLIFMKEIPGLASPLLFAIAQAMAARISEGNQRFQREKAAEFVWH